MTEIMDFISQQNDFPEDLKSLVENKINQEKKNIEKILQESINLKEQLDVTSTSQITKGMTIIAEELKVVEAESKDWEQVATALREKVKELNAVLAARPSSKYVETLVKKINKITSEHLIESKQLKSKIKTLTSSLKEKDETIDEMNTEIVETNEELEESKSVIAGLKSKLKEAKDNIATLNTKISKLKESHSEELDDLKESYTPTLTKPADVISGYLKLDESEEVGLFWEQLLERHGRTVRPFKNKIMECKTLREAKSIYNSEIISSLSDDIRPLTESNSITREERSHLLESQGFKKADVDIVAKTLSKKGWI
jgi:chromosome segregation ATPase